MLGMKVPRSISMAVAALPCIQHSFIHLKLLKEAFIWIDTLPFPLHEAPSFLQGPVVLFHCISDNLKQTINYLKGCTTAPFIQYDQYHKYYFLKASVVFYPWTKRQHLQPRELKFRQALKQVSKYIHLLCQKNFSEEILYPNCLTGPHLCSNTSFSFHNQIDIQKLFRQVDIYLKDMFGLCFGMVPT